MLAILARNWWAIALRGLIAVLFGVAAFIWPGLTLTVLVILWGAYAFVDGVFALVAAVRAAEQRMTWWPFVLSGILGIAAGILSKTGAWFNYGDTRLGQGRENARDFLKQNPEIAQRIDDEIRGKVASIEVGPEGISEAAD